MIFSGQAPDGTIHTDQGKQPDRQEQQIATKIKLPFKIIREKKGKFEKKKNRMMSRLIGRRLKIL
jgi:hypothetical protein